MTEPTISPDFSGFESLLRLREGVRLYVYRDSRGIPTCGVGHRVLPGDNLAVDDPITQEQSDAFLAADSAGAWRAAGMQMEAAEITDPAFQPWLASVCFQLGNNWTAEWPHTWKMICDGEYAAAANALTGTPWSEETPVRVADFQAALRALPEAGATS